jgi:hypothetical protein
VPRNWILDIEQGADLVAYIGAVIQLNAIFMVDIKPQYAMPDAGIVLNLNQLIPHASHNRLKQFPQLSQVPLHQSFNLALQS